MRGRHETYEGQGASAAMAWRALTAAILLAGCSAPAAPGGSAAQEAIAGLRIEGTYDVAVTPGLPDEVPGFFRAARVGDTFALDVEREIGLPRHAVLQGDWVYASRNGMAWTREGLDQALDE